MCSKSLVRSSEIVKWQNSLNSKTAKRPGQVRPGLFVSQRSLSPAYLNGTHRMFEQDLSARSPQAENYRDSALSLPHLSSYSQWADGTASSQKVFRSEHHTGRKASLPSTAERVAGDKHRPNPAPSDICYSVERGALVQAECLTSRDISSTDL